MDDNESYTPEDLEKCSYRYLQQVAKTMKLPANVKKVHLIKMIHAKKYSSTSEFQNIVQNVYDERKFASQYKKLTYMKKAKIQGGEVTSSNRYSPPAILSHPEGHIVIRCPDNCRRPMAKSVPLRTDRVLRSTGREPEKYKYLNTVIGVIKSQSNSANTQTHTISSRRRRSIQKRPKFVISKFKTNILNCNTSMVKRNEENTVQFYARNSGPVTSTPVPSKRLRTISGLYPLNPSGMQPQLSYMSTKTFNFRRQDGTLARFNLPQPNFNSTFENFVENKQNQATVTVQDIINSNIEEQIFSNSNMAEYMLTDSEQHNNIDYPNMSMVTETSTFINQPTLVLENPVLNETRYKNLNDNIVKIRNLLKERQSLRIEISKPDTPTYTGGEELKNLLLMKQPESVNNNQQNTHLSEPSYVLNQSKYPRLLLNLNTPQSNDSTPLANCNSTPLNHSSLKSNHNSTQLNDNSTHLDHNSTQLNHNSSQTNLVSTQLNHNSTQLNHNSTQLNHKSTQFNQNSTQLNHKSTQLNQINSASTETSYITSPPRFTGNQLSVENDDSPEFSVYCHRSIREEQVRSKRNTYQRETSREGESLPKIGHVFSQFNNVRQSLNVQVSNEAERIFNPVSMKENSSSILESLYNFKNSFITNQPLMKIVTTSGTKCVYSTPTISTPIAQTSLGDQFFTSQPDNQQHAIYHNDMPRIGDCLTENQVNLRNEFSPARPDNQQHAIYHNDMPRIGDCLTENQVNLRNEFSPAQPDNQQHAIYHNDMPRIGDCLTENRVNLRNEFSPDTSDFSSPNDCKSSDPNVSIPEMVEDALELISQDGDYMERINMDVRMQCFLCNWAGPRIILECHVRKEHTIQTACMNESCCVVFTLTSLRNVWNSRVLEKNNQLYVISSKWEDKWLFATLTTLSPTTPKSGSIMFHNRISLETITWRGEILQIHSNMPYENHNDGLKLNFNNTDVFEKYTSSNECFFTFFVRIFD